MIEDVIDEILEDLGYRGVSFPNEEDVKRSWRIIFQRAIRNSYRMHSDSHQSSQVMLEETAVIER